MRIVNTLRHLCFGIILIMPITSFAVDAPTINSDNAISFDELLNVKNADTRCASAAFADGLAANADKVDAESTQTEIQQWIYQTFADADVLSRVLACPEIANTDDDATIRFIPIKYTFPGGREIVINYETQPHVLRHRLHLATRRGAITPGMASPQIGGDDDDAEWSYPDPAWYGIMVVEHGALNEFAGPDKNNTISMKYINDNIDKLYPKNMLCTSKSAIAYNKDELNIVVHNSVNIEDDSNDYYVAGDVSLEWISYAEIALDVVITVATMGVGAAILGVTKAARASRVLKGMGTSMRTLRKAESVQNYLKLSARHARIAREIKELDKVNDATNAAAKTAKSDELKKLADAMRKLEKNDENVKKYKETADSFVELNKYKRQLLAMRRPAQRGNIIARTFRAFRAANTGGKKISRGARIARSSMKSGKIRDWLFQATLKNAGKLAKLEETGGFLYGFVNAVGDFYDYTESSTGEYTNGIDFKPLLLLSADDLPDQGNIVNYGMWLLWMGDSTDPADDDAAYLQAMDFAEKVWQDFATYQSEKNVHACNIDLYVVRPVIRNPGSDEAEFYYLIMNDEPWTTANE